MNVVTKVEYVQRDNIFYWTNRSSWKMEKLLAHIPLLQVYKCYMALYSHSSNCVPGYEAVKDTSCRN